jgi:hypothetical protein
MPLSGLFNVTLQLARLSLAQDDKIEGCRVASKILLQHFHAVSGIYHNKPRSGETKSETSWTRNRSANMFEPMICKFFPRNPIRNMSTHTFVLSNHTLILQSLKNYPVIQCEYEHNLLTHWYKCASEFKFWPKYHENCCNYKTLKQNDRSTEMYK